MSLSSASSTGIIDSGTFISFWEIGFKEGEKQTTKVFIPN
jgi:hypothetical protein